ncbi:Thiol:disulfide interchange protein [gamma proteobacterium HdN1]|nr:Thiol:disulfide interchange protein [gamma proteobacterium HdN1]
MWNNSLRVGLIGLAFLLLTGFTGERFLDGTDYKVIPNGKKSTTPTVIEFFSYGCSHCFSVEGDFEKWFEKKKDSVKVLRIPAAWNPRFEALARLYLALDEMGIAEAHSEAIFTAIHTEHRDLSSKTAQMEFLRGIGVDSERFGKLYDSPEVNERVEASIKALVKYRIGGVPAFVVNDLYFTDIGMGGQGAALFDVIDFLLAR